VPNKFRDLMWTQIKIHSLNVGIITNLNFQFQRFITPIILWIFHTNHYIMYILMHITSKWVPLCTKQCDIYNHNLNSKNSGLCFFQIGPPYYTSMPLHNKNQKWHFLFEEAWKFWPWKIEFQFISAHKLLKFG
jgi:hypothetical protein